MAIKKGIKNIMRYAACKFLIKARNISIGELTGRN